jgi:hypothetical protein
MILGALTSSEYLEKYIGFLVGFCRELARRKVTHDTVDEVMRDHSFSALLHFNAMPIDIET